MIIFVPNLSTYLIDALIIRLVPHILELVSNSAIKHYSLISPKSIIYCIIYRKTRGTNVSNVLFDNINRNSRVPIFVILHFNDFKHVSRHDNSFGNIRALFSDNQKWFYFLLSPIKLVVFVGIIYTMSADIGVSLALLVKHIIY